MSNGEDWNAIDSSVLSERLDLSYDPRGRTAVTRTRKRRRRLSARSSMRGRVKRRKKSNKRTARRKVYSLSLLHGSLLYVSAHVHSLPPFILLINKVCNVLRYGAFLFSLPA